MDCTFNSLYFSILQQSYVTSVIKKKELFNTESLWKIQKCGEKANSHEVTTQRYLVNLFLFRILFFLWYILLFGNCKSYF